MLHRRIQLESLAFAFAGTALVVVTYGFLEGAGFPRLTAWWVWVGGDAVVVGAPPLRGEAALPVSNRLRVLRAERKWSQVEPAERLGVPPIEALHAPTAATAATFGLDDRGRQERRLPRRSRPEARSSATSMPVRSPQRSAPAGSSNAPE